jgi:quinoprotein glucose dehydrogenase
MALVPVWVVVGLITVSSLAFDQHRIDGQLNEDIVSADPEMGDISDNSWHAYGRSNMGQRYSPLDQITVENAGTLEKAWEYQTGDLQGQQPVPVHTSQLVDSAGRRYWRETMGL